MLPIPPSELLLLLFSPAVFCVSFELTCDIGVFDFAVTTRSLSLGVAVFALPKPAYQIQLEPKAIRTSRHWQTRQAPIAQRTCQAGETGGD